MQPTSLLKDLDMKRDLLRQKALLVLSFLGEMGILVVVAWKMFSVDRETSSIFLSVFLILFLVGILIYAALSQGTHHLLKTLSVSSLMDEKGEVLKNDYREKLTGVRPLWVRLLVTEDTSISAVAISSIRENNSIVVSSSILDILERNELEAILIHESMHLRNSDPLLRRILMFSIGLFGFLSYGAFQMIIHGGPEKSLAFRMILLVFWPIIPFLLIFAWTTAALIRFTFTCQENIADMQTISIIGNSDSLIDALQKLHANPNPLQTNKSRFSLLLNIIKPSLDVDSFEKLYSSHLKFSKRIEMLSKWRSNK